MRYYRANATTEYTEYSTHRNTINTMILLGLILKTSKLRKAVQTAIGQRTKQAE